MKTSWGTAFKVGGGAALAGWLINVTAWVIYFLIVTHQSVSRLDESGIYLPLVALCSLVIMFPGFLIIGCVARWLPITNRLWQPERCTPWGAAAGVFIGYVWSVVLEPKNNLIPRLDQAGTWYFAAACAAPAAVTTYAASFLRRRIAKQTL